jgi:photosystem II protein
MVASIQFVKGISETVLANVQLTRSRDKSTGTATFRFKNPDALNDTSGDITGMYLIDDEGVLYTNDVRVLFVKGQPKIIEALYIMRSLVDWERFMRFIKNYGDENGLTFIPADSK